VPKIIFVILFLCSVLHGGYTENREDNAAEIAAVEFDVSFAPADISFNPLHTFTATEAQIYTALFEGLVSYHPLTMEPLPAAAFYWEVSEDGTVYRFLLRENGRYWNGDPVTAYDFRKSWLTLLDPEEKSEYSFLFDMVKNAKNYRTGKIKNENEVGIHALSPFVLEVELEHPARHFLKVLCHHSFVPVHPKFLDKSEWDKTNIIPGNGPYYVYSQNDEKIVLLKNRLYWDEKNVEADKIIIHFHEDPAESTQKFNAKKMEWVADGIILHQVENTDAIVINPLFATNYFFFSCKEAPWNNPPVRKALALALPWDTIRSERFMYLPTARLIPKLPHYPAAEGIEENNTEEALRILEEEGFPRGEGLPEVVIKIPSGFESRRIALLMQQAWEEVLEVEVSVEEYDFSEYYNVLRDTEYTLGTISWIGDFADPLTFLQMWTTDSNLNDAGYNNYEYESIIEKTMTQSGIERYRTLAEAEEILLKEAVVLPINHLPAWNLVDLFQIGGWFPNPLDIHPFKYLRSRKLEIGPGIARKSVLP
jgi:oligopeptide transport system substrate-binding protein